MAFRLIHVYVVAIVASLVPVAVSFLHKASRHKLQNRRKHREAAAEQQCLVFHSQHKSAGFTIESILEQWPLNASSLAKEEWEKCEECRFICDDETWDCAAQTCDPVSTNYKPEYNPRSSARVAYRGYTPRLIGSDEWGSPGDGRCVWATISREPVARLVSAYFYCQSGSWPEDPLCGSSRIDVKNATILQWAKHWGNFLFRELLWHPKMYEVAKTRAEFSLVDKCTAKEPWLQLKDQLGGGDDPRTSSGLANMAEVVNLRSHRRGAYDILGVVERWNETMAQFDERVPLQGASWVELTASMKEDHGSSDWKDAEMLLLEQARKDPDVLNELKADIFLYESVIVRLFEQRVAQR